MVRVSSINKSLYIAEPYSGMSVHNNIENDCVVTGDPFASNDAEVPPYKYSPLTRSIPKKSRSKSYTCSTKPVLYSNKTATEQSICTMEVLPGIHMLLLGADATLKAIRSDSYKPCTCIGCNDEVLFCVDHASFVLCPKCYTISPTNTISLLQDASVGIGFTFYQLGRWQTEMRREN
jgi:hypothetical protein